MRPEAGQNPNPRQFRDRAYRQLDARWARIDEPKKAFTSPYISASRCKSLGATHDCRLLSADHAIRAGLLPGSHRDPFDRMLIAQAQAENLPILSSDSVFDSYSLRRIW